MPRTGGVYSAPSGTKGVPNTTIASTPYNSFVDDLVNDANAARPVSAGGIGASTAVGGADNLSTTGSNIASASTTNLSAATGVNVTITGTTTISSFGAATAGIKRYLTFSSALTLTYNATSMILPGAADITTAANDTAIALSLGSGNWRIVSYTRAAQTPVTFAGLASKTTPADADGFIGLDSAASSALKQFTWANIKATLKTYFDALYPSVAGATFTGQVNFGPTGGSSTAVLAMQKRSSGYGAPIKWQDGSGVDLAQIAASPSSDISFRAGDSVTDDLLLRASDGKLQTFSGFVGDGSGVTSVNASQLNGQSASYYATAATTMAAGNGLTGGGDLSTNRSFAVSAGTGISVGTSVGVDSTVWRNGNPPSAATLISALGYTPTNKAGDSMTGRLSVAGNTTSGILGSATPSLGEVEVKGNGAGPAMAAYYRPGVYGAYFGLDTDNIWKVGGWSMGSNSYKVLHEGLSSGSFSGAYTWSGAQTFSASATLNSGLTMGSAVVTNGYDLSRHLALYSTTYGLSVTGSTLNFVSSSAHKWWAGTSNIMSLDSAGHLSVATPTSSGHAATKSYVDSAVAGVWSASNQPSAATIAGIYAGVSAGGVGSLAWAKRSAGGVSFGATAAGSGLVPTNANATTAGSALSGTWMCLGQTTTGADIVQTTLFMRIS